jgi:hypothetical protein
MESEQGRITLEGLLAGGSQWGIYKDVVSFRIVSCLVPKRHVLLSGYGNLVE